MNILWTNLLTFVCRHSSTPGQNCKLACPYGAWGELRQLHHMLSFGPLSLTDSWRIGACSAWSRASLFATAWCAVYTSSQRQIRLPWHTACLGVPRLNVSSSITNSLFQNTFFLSVCYQLLKSNIMYFAVVTAHGLVCTLIIQIFCISSNPSKFSWNFAQKFAPFFSLFRLRILNPETYGECS